MPTIIEVNVATGEQVEREMTPEEVASLPEPTPPPVPMEVGRVQAKIWLHRAGKLAAVQAYIDGAEDPELTLWWNEANTFRRDNTHVVALSAGFDIDLDAAFTEAAGIG